MDYNFCSTLTDQLLKRLPRSGERVVSRRIEDCLCQSEEKRGLRNMVIVADAHLLFDDAMALIENVDYAIKRGGMSLTRAKFYPVLWNSGDLCAQDWQQWPKLQSSIVSLYVHNDNYGDIIQLLEDLRRKFGFAELILLLTDCAFMEQADMQFYPSLILDKIVIAAPPVSPDNIRSWKSRYGNCSRIPVVTMSEPKTFVLADAENDSEATGDIGRTCNNM